MTTSNEHNNAPAVPQGWTDADSDAARLALELECLLMDTKDLSVVSKWWGSANDALELHRQRLAATPAPAPAQSFDEVWYSIDWNEWRMKPIRELIQMIHSKTAPASAQEPAHQYTQHVIAGGGEITVTKDGKPAYVITAREASQAPASAQEPAHQYTHIGFDPGYEPAQEAGLIARAQHVIAGGGEITVAKDGKPAYVITAREASQEPNK